MIQWKKQPQEVTILLCAMIYSALEAYAGIKSCPDARRLYRAYKQGLKAMNPETRYYFHGDEIDPRYYSDEARTEADRIFWENF